jgi:hypothetical protein
LEAEQYTILDILFRQRRTRVLPALRADRLQRRLVEGLSRRDLSAQVLYALVLLDQVSQDLSLDFYAFCRVCQVPRKKRRTLRQILTRLEKLEFLRKNRHCHVLISTAAGLVAPPTVRRELEEGEFKNGTRQAPLYDLAVLFKSKEAAVPTSWIKALGGRVPRAREGYQLNSLKVEQTLALLLSITCTLLGKDSISALAEPQIEIVHERLQDLIRHYEPEDEYQVRLRMLEASLQKRSDNHALAFAGFTLL